MSRCIFLLAGIFAFVLGYAQCPDSVRVYVYPEVICPGEVVHLNTDSTRLHCVNIGDIICVHNVSYDTVIVSPSDWTRLSLASSYSPLSVVFYVDSTCQHGWAVQGNTVYEAKQWVSTRNPRDQLLDNFTNERLALGDLNGFSNWITVTTQPQNSGTTTYPAFSSCLAPFYLPAIGQLNVLFSIKNNISQILGILGFSILPENTGDYWWSSTEFSNKNAWALHCSNGSIENQAKTKSFHVIPVMNF